MNDRLPEDGAPDDRKSQVSDATAWSMIATLVAGPATWGGIGWVIDHLLETGRIFTLVGVIVGFVTGIYVVYTRYGRLSGGVGDGR